MQVLSKLNETLDVVVESFVLDFEPGMHCIFDKLKLPHSVINKCKIS